MYVQLLKIQNNISHMMSHNHLRYFTTFTGDEVCSAELFQPHINK